MRFTHPELRAIRNAALSIQIAGGKQRTRIGVSTGGPRIWHGVSLSEGDGVLNDPLALTVEGQERRRGAAAGAKSVGRTRAVPKLLRESLHEGLRTQKIIQLKQWGGF